MVEKKTSHALLGFVIQQHTQVMEALSMEMVQMEVIPLIIQMKTLNAQKVILVMLTVDVYTI